jgi:hypothetical protein
MGGFLKIPIGNLFDIRYEEIKLFMQVNSLNSFSGQAELKNSGYMTHGCRQNYNDEVFIWQINIMSGNSYYSVGFDLSLSFLSFMTEMVF